MADAPTATAPSILSTLPQYLEAVRQKYDACIAHIDHAYTVDGVTADIRLHYVKFDGTGRPKFGALASALASHIVYYCISSKRRTGSLRIDEISDLDREARDYFRQNPTAGEPGELLLYFLVEAILNAPQMVCKMELKTNRNDETKGADGIHLAYDEERDCLNVYLGEAKLIGTYSEALSKAFKSITTFHERRQERHELKLVTKHFKAADERLKQQVTKYLDDLHPEGSCRIIHACLIGYDSECYGEIAAGKAADFAKQFETLYRAFFETRIKPKLDEHCAGFGNKSLSFEFFFIPFSSVQEFRNEFLREVLGFVPT